jgi:hypothetical protein
MAFPEPSIPANAVRVSDPPLGLFHIFLYLLKGAGKIIEYVHFENLSDAMGLGYLDDCKLGFGLKSLPFGGVQYDFR